MVQVTFQRQPDLQVEVEGRRVRSRTYLIALEADLVSPSIPGLNCLTIDDLVTQAQIEGGQWPQDIVVIGGGPTAVVLSQSLARLGTKVTLVVRNSGVLPDEDGEAAFLIQAQLEADGVTVLTHCVVEEAIALPGQRQKVVTNAAELETQAVLWAEDQGGRPIPWNGAQLGLKSTHQGLWVNPQLQTSHPRIYACGAILGGYPFAHVARYEASVALKKYAVWSVLFGGLSMATLGCVNRTGIGSGGVNGGASSAAISSGSCIETVLFRARSSLSPR